MENLPLVSVLIPVYNVEPFVEMAIQSIMDQTYTNLEIIIVDDCSSDRTLDIVEGLAKKDARIKILKNNTNSKIVKSLNYAIAEAKGAFFARMDGDDISLPNRIAEQYKFLVENTEIALVGLNVIMIDVHGNEIHKERYLESFEQIKIASEYVSPIPHFWLARRCLYENVGLYRIPSAEDLDFILRCIDGGYQVANLKDFLYLQRMRDGNTATALGLIQRRSIFYARKLHQERLAVNKTVDSYTENRLKTALSISSFERKMYKLSSYFHFRYVETKGKIKVIPTLYRGLSILLYPKYQIQEVVSRYKYKRLINYGK